MRVFKSGLFVVVFILMLVPTEKVTAQQAVHKPHEKVYVTTIHHLDSVYAKRIADTLKLSTNEYEKVLQVLKASSQEKLAVAAKRLAHAEAKLAFEAIEKGQNTSLRNLLGEERFQLIVRNKAVLKRFDKKETP